MVALPFALIASVWIALCASVTLAQDAPDRVLGTASGTYLLFTPEQVVEAGGGTTTPLSDAVPLVEAGTGNAGQSTAASRGDHVHPAFGGGSTTPLSNTPPLVEGVAAPGQSTAASRGDHVHPLRTLPYSASNPKVAGTASPGTLTVISRGDHVHPRLLPATSSGVANECLKVNSTGTGYTLAACGGGAGGGGGGTVTLTEIVSGTAPTTTDISPEQCAMAPDNSLIYMRVTSTTSSGVDVFKFLVRDYDQHDSYYAYAFSGRAGEMYLELNANCALDGSRRAGYFSYKDGSGRMSFGTASIGGGGGGTASIDYWTDPAKNLGLPAAGSSDKVARGDHVHSQTSFLAVGIPPRSSGTGAIGTSTLAARSDHMHPSPATGLPALPSGLSNHYLRGRSTGTNWQSGELVPHYLSSDANDCLRINAAGTGMTWVACPGGGASLSDKLPLADAATASAGSGAAASREDHVHPLPAARSVPNILTPIWEFEEENYPEEVGRGFRPAVLPAAVCDELKRRHVFMLEVHPVSVGEQWQRNHVFIGGSAYHSRSNTWRNLVDPRSNRLGLTNVGNGQAGAGYEPPRPEPGMWRGNRTHGGNPNARPQWWNVDWGARRGFNLDIRSCRISLSNDEAITGTGATNFPVVRTTLYRLDNAATDAPVGLTQVATGTTEAPIATEGVCEELRKPRMFMMEASATKGTTVYKATYMFRGGVQAGGTSASTPISRRSSGEYIVGYQSTILAGIVVEADSCRAQATIATNGPAVSPDAFSWTVWRLDDPDAANPGTTTPLSDDNPQTTASAPHPGVATAASRADHVHAHAAYPYSDVGPSPLGASASAGASANLSRADHVHLTPIPARPGGATTAATFNLQSYGSAPALRWTAANPSIPKPGPASAGHYLRVDAAGRAYEISGDLDADITEIEGGIAALQRATQDLSVASVQTPWATSTVQGAGIATGTCSTSAAPSSGYSATKARPASGWPANTCVFAQLPKGADVTTYRVTEPQGDSATFFDPGGSWRLKLGSPSSATRDYYLVNTVSPGDQSLTLQHGGTIQRTTFRGRIAGWGGDLPAIPSDAASKQYALETTGAGTGVTWSNDIFSALSINAQDIGDAEERIDRVEAPHDAEASSSTLAAGQVWEIQSCKDAEGSRTCTAGFSTESRGKHQLVTHGTGAPNSTTQSFAGTGRLTQHALISGTSYDEFLIVVRHIAGNPVRTVIRSCTIPGIQGDWLANATHAVVLTSEGGACTLTAPTTGNLTLTWVSPLAGQKIAGDTWRLYGVDWQ